MIRRWTAPCARRLPARVLPVSSCGVPLLLALLLFLLAALPFTWPLPLPFISPRNAHAARPELAAAASLFLPGVGQMANGDYAEGSAQLGGYFVLGSQYLLLIDQPDYLEPADRVNHRDRTLEINRTTFTADLYGTALNTLSFYSAFGAYRDARQQADAAGSAHYSTPTPQETLGDLALAPFRWDTLSRPSTFLPLILPLLFLAVEPGEDDYVTQPLGTLTREELAAGYTAQHHMVAVGEEALFRGVLNTSLSDSFGETWGLLGSSALFGIGHEGVGGQASAGGAFVYGLYLGWLQQRNGYQIGQGVALHYWWNLLTSLSYLQQHPEGEAQLLSLHLRF